MGTIANKDDEHWVGLATDCEKEMVAYGDGFGAKVPQDLWRHVDSGGYH
jgi:hypothetical protein